MELYTKKVAYFILVALIIQIVGCIVVTCLFVAYTITQIMTGQEWQTLDMNSKILFCILQFVVTIGFSICISVMILLYEIPIRRILKELK